MAAAPGTAPHRSGKAPAACLDTILQQYQGGGRPLGGRGRESRKLSRQMQGCLENRAAQDSFISRIETFLELKPRLPLGFIIPQKG